MKIFVTNGGLFWDLDSWVFKEFTEDIVEVSYYSSDTKHPEYIQISREPERLFIGMDEVGFSSYKYQGLLDHKDRIIELVTGNGEEPENIIVLADGRAYSLYIYDVLREINKTIAFNLHLWVITPFSAQSHREIKEYHEMLNTEGIKSLTLLSGDKMLSEAEAIYGDIIFERFKEYVSGELSRRLNEFVYEMLRFSYMGSYFYDTSNEKYVHTDMDVDTWEMDNANGLVRQILGRADNPYQFDAFDDMVTYDTIAGMYPRVNGKQICHKLKKMRKQFAEKNGIAYEFKECKYEGPCSGTCPYCEKELEDLEKLAENPEYPFVRMPLSPDDAEIERCDYE